MGKIIERIAIDRNHEIVLKIDQDNQHELTAENLRLADVAIEFSTPATVLANIKHCLNAGTPIVVGTTGWYNELAAIRKQCEEGGNSLIYASNFSVGVNLFFHVNKVLARLMNNYPYYEVQVEEIHHTQKLDSPSGTAITIAEGIIENLDAKSNWVNVLTTGEPAAGDEAIVPGTHTVIYDSEVDMIEFKHTAHNRNGFALGAVMAAEWIKGHKGFHSVQDMFDFDIN